MKQESIQAMREFTARAREAFDQFVDGVEDAEYVKAAELILASRQKGGRLHITGIGKPGHVSGYGASLLSSTGTPTYFLHGTEAVHGSCGQLVPGETAEMKTTVTAIKNNGCEVIGVSGNPDSWLAKQSAAHLFAGVCCEGGPLNRAPRASILAENFVLQRLSVLLQANRGLDPKQYVMWHPGGTLGQLRDNEK